MTCREEGELALENPPLEPGQHVDVVLPDPEDAEKELVFFAKVTSAKDGVFLITQPQKDGEIMPYPGLPCEVLIRLPKDASVWFFRTQLTNVMGDSFVLTMPDPELVAKEQHRSHVRANFNMKVQAMIQMANRYFADMTVEILDMSMGGCQIMGDRPFIPNTVLRLKIPLPGKVIDVHGKVVRPNPFPQGVNKRGYVTGFTFTRLSEADRELLLKFIFDKMRDDAKQDRAI